MKLSDLMSSMGLAIWAELGLVIFFGVFVAVSIQLLRRQNQAEFERARLMPLDDDEPIDPIAPRSDAREDR